MANRCEAASSAVHRAFADSCAETVKKLEASTPENNLEVLQKSIEEAYRLASGESVASTAKEPERQVTRSSPVASTPAKGLI